MDLLPLPRLARNGLAAPTADDVRRALRAVAREQFPRLWEQVCATAGVSQAAYLLDLDQAARLAAAVAQLPGVCGLAGHSMAARIASYRALAGVEDQGGTAAWDWSRRSMETLLRSRLVDRERLEEIVELDLLHPRTGRRLDQAARAAAERFGTSAAAVTLVLDGSQLLLGGHGFSGWYAESGGAPVEWSLCATTVRTRQPYVVEDTRSDVVQRTNPLVRHDGLARYVGVPLITSRGHVLGAYCVLDGVSGPVDPADVQELEQMAARLVEELERGRRPAAAATAAPTAVPAG